MLFKALRTMSREDFGKQKLLQVFALKNTKIGEELFLDWGEKFIF